MYCMEFIQINWYNGLRAQQRLSKCMEVGRVNWECKLIGGWILEDVGRWKGSLGIGDVSHSVGGRVARGYKQPLSIFFINWVFLLTQFRWNKKPVSVSSHVYFIETWLLLESLDLLGTQPLKFMRVLQVIPLPFQQAGSSTLLDTGPEFCMTWSLEDELICKTAFRKSGCRDRHLLTASCTIHRHLALGGLMLMVLLLYTHKDGPTTLLIYVT